jgi:hypothetical protein
MFKSTRIAARRGVFARGVLNKNWTEAEQSANGCGHAGYK